MSFLLLLMSSTKLKKRIEQVLPGSERVWGRERWWGAREKDGPNNVCTYE
jgi:hypothetical protein